MQLQLDPDDVDTYSTDNRGRITLGSDLANREGVEVALIDTGQPKGASDEQ